jgi:hypothetical protein
MGSAMKSYEFLTEGLNHPIICVDVQPEYAQFNWDNAKICSNIIQFVNKQTGPVLFFVNAEDQGLSGDTVNDIRLYWEYEATGGDDDWYDAGNPAPIGWDRFTIVDKGYGYLRSWMDQGVSAAGIIKTIRAMYQQKVQDSRMLFGGEDSDEQAEAMAAMLGFDFEPWMLSDAISINWTSIAQLKRFNGAYIVGGGRDECLREVELLMNAFNIKYKRIDSLVY